MAPPTAAERRTYADAIARPFWLDRLPARDPQPALHGTADADLCIVGGGFTGLWAALQAKVDAPDRDVVLLEARTVGFGASGRNGGFILPSLTHGRNNGLARFRDEIDLLERLGRQNLRELIADLDRYGIECDLELTGDLLPSVAPYQDALLEEERELAERYGYEVETFGDAASIQAEVASPIFRAGLWIKDEGGIVDPAKLAVGLLGAAVRQGVRVYELTAATALHDRSDGVEVRTDDGAVRARRVLLGTSAFPPLVRAMRRYVAPVYDYALVTEPLTREQRDAIGWRRRQGIGDGGNQFHYYRLTDDDRILWGGFDAVYRFGGPVRDELDDHDPTFGRLAQNFLTVFPQLKGIRFSHRWGGAIDTCSRFSVFFGTAHRGRVAYAIGYTGLGVGATRFGARVALDLLDGRSTEATRTRYASRKPVPFPPEPLRTAAIQLTRNRLAAADRRDGRRGIWLGLLDRVGLGFDS
ncbi:MAG TPA: FAD-dependent oxidoreductase [Solirubrobacteraceae bacterium]|jgi:glycine/D-amino acid oxidase-like deaminating enzyme